jgi:hypothetical protein
MKQLLIILFLFLCHLTFAQTQPLENPTPKRTIVSKPNTSAIHHTESCSITLRITLNSEGIICTRPVLVRDRTTTSNMDLINLVIDLVQRETVYSKSDKVFETVMITIRINSDIDVPIIP